MSVFLCTTCGATVPSARKVQHCLSEWHVYNLRRVQAGLSAIGEELFSKKRECFFTEPSVKENTYCQFCKRLFANKRSYDAHLTSKKHIVNSKTHRPSNFATHPTKQPIKTDAPNITHTTIVPAAAEEEETELSESEVAVALPLGYCLFCDKQLKLALGQSEQDLAGRVLDHMRNAHKFVVPYPHKLVDKAGLLQELGRIVGAERACLTCGRQFYGMRYHATERKRANGVDNSSSGSDNLLSLRAVRQHMLQKNGHICLWCGEDDPVKLALLVAECNVASNGSAENLPAAALVGGELFSQFYDGSNAISSFILPYNDDGMEAYEVRLPSGTVISNRSMRLVYNQHTPALQPERIKRDAICLTSNARLPIGSSLSSTVAINRPGHLCNLKTNNIIADRHSERARTNWALSVGINGNLTGRARLRKQC